MKYKGLTFKYSLINAFFFMLVCGTAGYANNFLLAKGFDSSVIGIILTLISIIALAGQTGMAPVIDRSDKLDEKKFILITLVAAAVCYTLMLFVPDGSFLVIALVIIGFSVATMGMPSLNAIAFMYESEGQKINYGVSRGIGSLAYALSGQIIGRLLAWKTASVLPFYLAIMAVLTLAAVFTLQIPEKKVKKVEVKQEEKQISYGEFFKKYSNLLPVVAALIMMYFAHMLINNYMINIIEAIGGTTADQGNVITLQAMVELPPMFLFSVILKKVSVNKLMGFAGIMYAVKHILIFLAPNTIVFYGACVLQMFSYAILVPAAVYYATENVGEEDRNKGQAIFGATATIGGLFASFCGGFLLKAAGVKTTLLIGAVITAAGAVLMFFSTMKKKA